MEINRFFICFLITFYEIAESVRVERAETQGKLLSRKKRYLVFPEGASMSVAVCMTVGVYGNPQFSIFSYGLNYGFAYELPTNATLFLRHRDNIFGFAHGDDDEEDEDSEPLPPPPPPPPPAPLETTPETTQPTQPQPIDFEDHHYHPQDSGDNQYLPQDSGDNQYLPQDSGDNQYFPQDSDPPLNFDPNQFRDVMDSENSKLGYTFPWDTEKLNSLNIQPIPNRKNGNFLDYQRPLRVYPQRSYSSYVNRPMLQRRYRRDLYNKLEIAMDKMGFNGRECILRALCESSQVFGNKGADMISEIVRLVFSFPKSKTLSSEHEDLHKYDEAHRRGKNQVPCHQAFSRCEFSLISLALGKYSKPLYNYM